jgi:hypothetical protein
MWDQPVRSDRNSRMPEGPGPEARQRRPISRVLARCSKQQPAGVHGAVFFHGGTQLARLSILLAARLLPRPQPIKYILSGAKRELGIIWLRADDFCQGLTVGGQQHLSCNQFFAGS